VKQRRGELLGTILHMRTATKRWRFLCHRERSDAIWRDDGGEVGRSGSPTRQENARNLRAVSSASRSTSSAALVSLARAADCPAVRAVQSRWPVSLSGRVRLCCAGTG